MLRVTGLAFGYKKRPPVLTKIDFDLSPGESVCVLGPNGTGKTTLLRCLLGLNQPTAGEITWEGEDLLAMSRRQRSKRMAYVPQASMLNFPYEVREVVLMGRVAHLGFASSPTPADRTTAYQALERMGVDHLADRTFQSLSGGERQLVLIARALAQQSTVLILDEPTSALDFANQVRALSTVRQLADDGYAVLMTSHSPDHAFLASQRVLMIRDGQVYAHGEVDEVITAESLSGLYGTETAVVDTGISSSRGAVKVCVPILEAAQERNP